MKGTSVSLGSGPRSIYFLLVAASWLSFREQLSPSPSTCTLGMVKPSFWTQKLICDSCSGQEHVLSYAPVCHILCHWWDSLVAQRVESACSAGDLSSKDHVEKKIATHSNIHFPQYSCRENAMDRGPWQATVHSVAKSQRWLSAHICTHMHTCTHTHMPI